MPNLTPPEAHISLFHWGRIRVRTERIAAPAFLRGFRAAFVTDVHLRRTTPDRWLDALIDQIRALRPDILLLGGDYGEGLDQQKRFFAALTRLKTPPYGCFGVCGNNEPPLYPDLGALRGEMARGGARLLLNEHALVRLPGGTLVVAGVDDGKLGQPRPGLALRRCEGADYRILLTHAPRWPERRAELILAGHTHGGQFNVCGITPFTFGFEGNAYPLIRGRAERDGMTLLVSAGLGYSRLPLRLGVRPELHLLEFAAPEECSPD